MKGARSMPGHCRKRLDLIPPETALTARPDMLPKPGVLCAEEKRLLAPVQR